MRVTLRTKFADFTFDATQQAEAWEQMTKLVEVFAKRFCGHCGSDEIRPITRTAKNYTYFEWVCDKCQHTLKVHQNNNESRSLYISTWDSENNCVMPHEGWEPPYSGGKHEERSTMKTGGESRQTVPPVDEDDIPF